MIKIQKGNEPEKLTKLRQRTIAAGLPPKEAYKRLKNPLKGQVRQCLVDEQGGLCAYCMCRIPRAPSDGRDVGQGLDYQNLLAVCHGNRASGGTRKFMDLTCDAHRENTEFRKVNPCISDTLTSIFYQLDGKIGASDPDVSFDLLETLNLNCSSSPLIAERKAALDSLILALGNVAEDVLFDYCIAALEEFQAESNPKTPYVGILIWYLETLIDGLHAR